ncbi:MAG: hypothetical protein JF616_11030 [Fibrobacteres bacterium]|nr:hypothetical protein [Fibrobacterota bacterium]
MPLNPPWNLMQETLERLQDFNLGAQRLSDFYKSKEEKHGPDELTDLFFQGNPPQKLLERLLFFLFDIGVPDRQTGSRALELRRLRRLWKRIGAELPMTDTEHALADKTEWLFGRGPEELDAGLKDARAAFQSVLDGRPIAAEQRATLAGLIRAEAEALQDRVIWLSENTDPYNLKTMARILPRLRIYDEAVHEGLDLARRQEAGEPVGLKVVSFEAYMKEGIFNKWRSKVAKRESLARLAQLMETQRIKKIPTLDLIALSTLCRWTYEAIGETSAPLDWIEKAMACYRDGEFEVDAGQAARVLQPALSGSGAKMAGTRVTGNFGVKTFPAWIGRDLLTKSFLKGVDEGSLDIKAVITQNITRDSIVEALLNNPKVFQMPGLVAFICATSRSVALLSKIAKSRQLHTGFANRDVPLGLLHSPCNVPISLLRPFINVKYVALIDLKHLARAKAGIRRAVKDEAEAYLKSRQ